MPRMWDRKEAAMVGLESSGTPWKGRSVAKWHEERSSEKHRERGGQTKGCQENVQNVKRSMVKHRGREGRHA